MLIHLVTDHVRIEGLDDWLRDFASRLAAQSGADASVTEDPEAAGAILFLSSGVKRSGLVSRNHLTAHPLARRFRHKCFLWCTDDQPLSYLPGLYASLPRRYHHPALHRTYTYFTLPTEDVPIPELPRDIYYNFIGGPTHPIRKRVTELAHAADTFVQPTATMNHDNKGSEDKKASFVAVLARSRFTLCPRGVGASSYRLFESMRCGSIPVIISDDLVLPEGPDWGACAVRVAEKDLLRLREILDSVKDHAARSAAAREAYERFFASQKHLRNIARLITSLQSSRPPLGANRLRFAAAQAEHAAGKIAGRLKLR